MATARLNEFTFPAASAANRFPTWPCGYAAGHARGHHRAGLSIELPRLGRRGDEHTPRRLRGRAGAHSQGQSACSLSAGRSVQETGYANAVLRAANRRKLARGANVNIRRELHKTPSGMSEPSPSRATSHLHPSLFPLCSRSPTHGRRLAA
jgi:hypothetical protein